MSFLRRDRAKHQATPEKAPERSSGTSSSVTTEALPTTPVPVQLAPALREWMAQPSWAASRAWLAAHLNDLPAEGVAALKAAALGEGDERECARLDLHAQVLMAARRDGVDRAYEQLTPPPDMPPAAANIPAEHEGTIGDSVLEPRGDSFIVDSTEPQAEAAPELVSPPSLHSEPWHEQLATPPPTTLDISHLTGEPPVSAPSPLNVRSEPWHEQLVAPPATTMDISRLTAEVASTEASATDEVADQEKRDAVDDASSSAPATSDEPVTATPPAQYDEPTEPDGDGAQSALDAVLVALASALDQPEVMQALIRAHAAEIVTPAALERAQALLAHAQAEGAGPDVIQRLEVVANLVQRFQGIDPASLATAEVTQQANPRATADLLIAWMRTPDWRSSREFLTEHQELLTRGVDGILAALAEQQDDARARQAVIEHLRLVELCREHGIEEGYHRFLAERRAAASMGHVDEFEGTAEVPPEARLAAQNALSNPRLREMLAEPVIEALQGLLEPSPSPRRIEEGLNALAVVEMSLERAYLQGVLTRLHPALWDWWNTPSWPASRAWLDAHLSELPSNAPALLRQAAEEARERGMEAGASSCERHAAILESAWREGVDAAYRSHIGADAFAEARDEDLSVLMSQIAAWINTPDWSSSLAYLKAHDHLLSTRAEGALQLLAETQRSQSRRVVEEHQRLLAYCRAFGIDEGYQRFLGELRADRMSQAQSTPPDDTAGQGGPTAVPPHIRQLVERVLAHPEGMPDEVLDALRPLLTPNPTPDQISTGLAALAAVGAVASQRHAHAILAKRSSGLAEWYDTPSWAASRAWLQAHLNELPANALEMLREAAAEARADGDEVSAEGIERHATLLAEAQRKGVDAAYRAIIGDDAFADDPHAGGTGDVRIGRQIETWIRSRDWASSREYLRAHPDILTDAGARVLQALDRAQRTAENHQIVADHIGLQREARTQGTDAAYDAFLAELARMHRPRGRPLNQEVERHLIEWLQTPTWDASRAYLTGHQQELLSDVGEANLASLLDVQANDNRRHAVAAHQHLLALCRRYGITDGYFRFFSEEPAQPMKQGTENAPTEVPSQARALAQRIIEQTNGLPSDIEEAIRGLLAPNPAPEQIQRGLAALTAVAMALSARHAHTLLERRSSLLAEWYATQTWPTSRAWLHAHLDELPTDAIEQLRSAAAEARADGDEVSADSIARHADILEHARREGVDAAYRTVVGEEAFASASEEDDARNHLIRVGQQVEAWIRTPDWDASREYLRAHPDLLGDTAATALQMLYEAQDDDGPRQIIADHQRLQRDARERGIDAAYDAFLREQPQQETSPSEADRALRRMGELLIAWMKTPTWEASRDYLAAHPELLTDEAEDALARLRDIQEQEAARHEIVRHQRLLAYCRALGVEGGYQRFLDEEQGMQTT